MRFNAPPKWPVPRGWSPPPNWEPPPSWPPAPAGWTFWVDEPAADIGGPAPDSQRRRWWHLSKGSAIAIAATTTLLAVVVVFVIANAQPVGIKLQPYTATVTPTANGGTPTWVDPGWGTTPSHIDFADWTRFGGIDASPGDGGESVRLDTHDTTDTWRTKWSGLISPKTTACSVRVVGRVRDISHTSGVSGGFSIGMGTLAPGSVDDAELAGAAIQFDFGQRGYRSAVYPSDTDNGLVPAALDHEWHQVELVMAADSHTLAVDGQTVVTAPAGRQCGQPFIRVWAGTAEFADFTVTPLD